MARETLGMAPLSPIKSEYPFYLEKDHYLMIREVEIQHRSVTFFVFVLFSPYFFAILTLSRSNSILFPIQANVDTRD